MLSKTAASATDKKKAAGLMLSKASTWWFYIAQVLALVPFLVLTGVSAYGLLYEDKRELFMHLIGLLAGANGLAAVTLTFKRKLYGIFWSFVPAVLICPFAASPDSGYTSNDFIPMVILLSVPVALLLSQIPTLRTLRTLKTLEPGWGLGSMAYANLAPKPTTSRALVWWYRIALMFSLLVYLALLIAFCRVMINGSSRGNYSLSLMGLAASFGFFAFFLTYKKEIVGVMLSLALAFS